MWCPDCQSETNAVGSGLSEQLRCESCGKAFVSGKPSDSSIRQARDIIARWSSDDLLDRITSLPDIPPMPKPHFAGQPAAEKEPKRRAEDVSPVVSGVEVDRRTDANSQPEDDNHRANTTHLPETVTVENEAERRTEDVRPQISAAETDHANAGKQPERDNQQDHTPGSQDTDRSPEKSGSMSVEELSKQFGLSAERPKFVSASASKTISSANAQQDHQPAPQPPSPVVEETDDVVEGTVEVQAKEQPFKSPPPIPAVHETPAEQKVDATDNVAKSDTAPVEAKESEPSVIPLSQRKRRPQKRHPQRRQQRERRSTVTNTDKGRTPVSQKYRVDSLGEELPEDAAEATQSSSGSRIQSNSPTGGRRFRIDTGEDVQQTLGTGDGRSRTDTHPRDRFIDEAHETALRGPHFQVTAPKRSNMTSLTGQFLAYLGVLGLTIGTAMVIYGHFGGYSEYTPTGWLVTTVAQMMLFLGVINLVSGGIEQNNDDVSARINTLGEQLMRIESVTEQALRGPKIPAHRYADPDSPVEEPQRETVPVGVRK